MQMPHVGVALILEHSAETCSQQWLSILESRWMPEQSYDLIFC